MSIHHLGRRLKVEASADTIRRAITKYGVTLCRLPARMQAEILEKAYLEGDVVEVYYVCAVSKFAEVLAHEVEASVANKQSNMEMAKYVADAINTAYNVECVPELSAIDIKLDMQKLRVVYLPSPSLLAVISLTGDAIQDGAPDTQVVNNGKREVTIKISL
jgi:hypothetical protein